LSPVRRRPRPWIDKETGEVLGYEAEKVIRTISDKGKLRYRKVGITPDQDEFIKYVAASETHQGRPTSQDKVFRAAINILRREYRNLKRIPEVEW